MILLLVGLGGFCGSILRYWCSERMNRKAIPYGTLFVNWIGSFMLGWLMMMEPSESMTLLFVVGFLGSLTTFSTLNWELFVYYQDRKVKNLILYAGLSYGLGMVCVFAGYVTARFLCW